MSNPELISTAQAILNNPIFHQATSQTTTVLLRGTGQHSAKAIKNGLTKVAQGYTDGMGWLEEPLSQFAENWEAQQVQEKTNGIENFDRHLADYKALVEKAKSLGMFGRAQAADSHVAGIAAQPAGQIVI